VGEGFGRLLMRPIKPEDEPLMVEFHRALSEESIHARYFAHMRLEGRINHERLARVAINAVSVLKKLRAAFIF